MRPYSRDCLELITLPSVNAGHFVADRPPQSRGTSSRLAEAPHGQTVRAKLAHLSLTKSSGDATNVPAALHATLAAINRYDEADCHALPRSLRCQLEHPDVVCS